MKILKDIVACAVLAACVALCLSLIRLVRDTEATVKAVPAEMRATRSAVLAEVHSDVESARRELLATVNTQATAIQKTADFRLGSIEQMVH